MARLHAPAVVSLAVLLGSAPVSPGEPPVFGSGVDLVLLDLVVRDRKGNLVRDLRLDEIEIREDGVVQRPTEFRAVELATGTGPMPDRPAAGAARGAAAVSGTPALQRRASRANLVALVFDQLSVDGRPLAAKAARELLDGPLDPGAYVAVFRIDGRLGLVEGFTREAAPLASAIERATLGNAPAFASAVQGLSGTVAGSRNGGDPLQRGYDRRELRPAHFAGDREAGSPMDGDGPLTVERKMANATLDILRTAEEVERTQRGNRSLDGLVSVVHGLRELPGRKTLVFFSEGLQVPPWLEDRFRGLVSEANRANVSVYAVDVRGLRVAGHMDDARALLEQAVMISQSQRLSGGNWHGVTREQAREFEAVETTLRMNAQGTLDDLARGTGGFLVGDSNDLARGIRRLGEDTRSYYEVAYTPSDRRADGRFHRLSVRVKRPGAVVQSREGYFAVPHAAGEPVLGYEGPLVAALAARRPPRQLEHGAAVFRFAAEGESVQHALVVAAPLERVRFSRDERAGRYLGRVSLLALVRSADGEIVEKLGQDSVIEGPLADLDQTRGRRLSFVRRLVLRPGTYSVETAVRDGLGDRVGCSRTRLVVAPPAPGVRLSSLVALAGAAPATGEGPDDPFRVGDVRMAPQLEGSLTAEAGRDGPAIYYVVYTQPGVAEPPRLALEIDRAGRVVRRGTIALPAADPSGRIPHVARLPTAALAPGEYRLRLSVTQGGSNASEELPLRIAAAAR